MNDHTQTTTPALSIVIPLYNGERFIADCLSSAHTAATFISHEIICVDDGSTDDSVAVATASGVTHQVLRNDRNYGFAHTCNRGLRQARGSYLMLLNQDTRCRPDALKLLLARLQQDEQIAFIGPKFVGFDGSLQKNCAGFPTPAGVFFKLSGLAALFPGSRTLASWRMSWFDHEHEAHVDQPMGAALLFRRDLLSHIGYLDESFPIFLNDVDWARRAVEAGYRNLYYPPAVIEHFVGSATRPQKPRMVLESHRSLRRYLRKWFPKKKIAVTAVATLLWFSGWVRSGYWRVRGSRHAQTI